MIKVECINRGGVYYMTKVFSWLIVAAGFLYFFGILALPFLFDSAIPFFVLAALSLGIIGAIGLIITLIMERIKDKKEEDKDDYSKY